MQFAVDVLRSLFFLPNIRLEKALARNTIAHRAVINALRNSGERRRANIEVAFDRRQKASRVS